MQGKELKIFLNKLVRKYNVPNFIANDPISIPYQFTKKQDIEIIGFFAAILAWGNRKSIINSCNKLLQIMGNKPHDYIVNTNFETKETFDALNNFVHRTFNVYDLLHLLKFLNYHYNQFDSLETAFSSSLNPFDDTVENALIGFHNYVFNYSKEAQFENHCKKHIATPLRKSACKRLNMYLRWMVRADDAKVDFGLWKQIKPSQLLCPLDVHVARQARLLGLITRKQDDWQTVIELTQTLKKFHQQDPVIYDFALFGLGVQ